MQINSNYNLSTKNFFGVGGVADFYFEPQSVEELKSFLHQNQKPYFVLGLGSNVLIKDTGYRGTVIKLGRAFNNIDINDTVITCAGGVSLIKLAKFACENCVTGFEFLCSIPGTLGGGIAMNAGAYGGALKDILLSITAITPTGEEVVILKDDINKNLSYRHNALPEGYIFISADLRGKKVPNNTDIVQTMTNYAEKRQLTQPVGAKTAGSTFKNPAENPAWWYIKQAGLQNLSYNGAKISEKHANFIVNTGTATASDIEYLIKHIQKTVYNQFNVALELEIKIIGA